MKQILFNTEMVKAVLDGRKTVTRRCIKLKHNNTHFEYRTDKYGTQFVEMQNDEEGVTYGTREDGSKWRTFRGYFAPKPKYAIGDILYVRETLSEHIPGRIIYKADFKTHELNASNIFIKWKPSIHMPKEYARLFLRVTDVRVERLQDITKEQAIKEGVTPLDDGMSFIEGSHIEAFKRIWNSTIEKSELDQYGWNANPYVFVYEFEVISKEQAYEVAE